MNLMFALLSSVKYRKHFPRVLLSNKNIILLLLHKCIMPGTIFHEIVKDWTF